MHHYLLHSDSLQVNLFCDLDFLWSAEIYFSEYVVVCKNIARPTGSMLWYGLIDLKEIYWIGAGGDLLLVALSAAHVNAKYVNLHCLLIVV